MSLSPNTTVRRCRTSLAVLAPALILLSGCVVAETPRGPRAVFVAPVAAVAVAPVFIAVPPPPLREEVIVARPSPAHVWIRGYWVWREGRHVWLAGHWERPPHPHAVWVAPRWERRREGYVFIEGCWR